MADVAAVLVVPAEGGPGGLLAEGQCGASPPVVGSGMADDSGRWHVLGPVAKYRRSARRTRALPLWWDGALVDSGWDRVRRVYRRECGTAARHDSDCDGYDYADDPDILAVLAYADGLVRVGLAERAVWLTRDAEGRLVEVADRAAAVERLEALTRVTR